jgi:hypothetical protein
MYTFHTAAELHALQRAELDARELYYASREPADAILYPTEGYNTYAERLLSQTLFAACNARLMYTEWRDARSVYNAARHHTRMAIAAAAAARPGTNNAISPEHVGARAWLSVNL